MMQTSANPPVSTGGGAGGGGGVAGANAALDALVEKWLDYGLLLLAVGTAAMAAVELIKALSRVRLFFHRRRVQAWVGDTKANGGREAYAQLIALVASDLRYANALFDQPAEKMMAQIQAAAGVAMDYPDRHPALYDFLTLPPRTDTEGEAQIAAFAASVEPAVHDAELWKKFATKHRASEEGVALMISSKGEATPESVQANEARSRLDPLVARRLDAFQTSVEYAWARWNQGLAGVGSFGVLLYILWGVADTTIAWLSWSVLGGFVSPFAKDFVSALQRLRA